MIEAPQITRIRHELRRRQLTVTRIERMPPNMLRVVLGGADLDGFTSLGFDDHVKLFFLATDGDRAPAMRDFTPRRFDAEKGELWIDFYLHDAGPAATWAAQAAVGQTLEVGGPKGSAVISPEGIDAHVLIGDETGLPAIGRRLDELPPEARTLVIIDVDADADRPTLAGRVGMDIIWVPRHGGSEPPGHQIIETLRTARLPPGQCFVWIAVESRAARSIRHYFREERGMDKQWIKAAGYWQRGAAGAHETITD